MQIVYKRNVAKKVALSGAALVLLGVIFAISANYIQPAASANQTCTSIYAPLPSWLSQRINENKATYQKVASETGVPWQIIAAVHYREYNNNASANPSNGQGIYQLYSVYYSNDVALRDRYRAIAHPSTTVTASNFLEQTRIAANFIQTKASASYTSTSKVTARKLTANETNYELLKSTLFSYNGRATAYATQAAGYGFDPASHPYEGSPYVMSKFDCYRESMGLITYDGGNTLTAKDTRMGAFTLYSRLRGDTFWKNLQLTSMKAASRVDAQVIKPSTDKSGDIAKVGFKLSRKPSHAVTLTYVASSPSNAKVLNSKVTIQPSSWNKPEKNVIQVVGLSNKNLNGTFEYSLVPTQGLDSKDSGFNSVVQSQLPQPKLIQQSVDNSNAVYRLYSTDLRKHAFTASGLERQALIAEGWRDEGSRFSYCTAGNQAVVKLHNRTTGEYRLATDGSKTYFDSLNVGFSYDKLDFATSSISGTPVYWRFDPTENRSLYTTNISEATTSPWVDRGVAFYACGPSSQAAYRMYQYSNNAHFITSSPSERNKLVSSGKFRYEGVSFYACKNGDIPLYRLYRPATGTHFLTTSTSERNSIVKNLGFRYEGVSMTLCSSTERPVYRLYRPANKAHFWTTSASERRSLSAADFRDENAKFRTE